ncbi:hypothetical protein CROQUDRAFT_100632 [Cronartium quercuum f. sp. fusiforme G11]|uniref:Uncharacterized protein n=1 Tax=Cronartium quercuum f. sp. fusiforme G11 TaxID=708437 RepID=A0A9P6N5Z4_9BASI|nr:hypothetical protein CROQUDRAFT_100632 [Cronartium quercuum f. sp. fusiforme G11]
MHPQSQNKLHTHHIWKKGSLATSIKALNASVASLLPTANDAISCSLALFTCILLNINQANKTYPSSPTPEEHQQLPVLTQSEIMQLWQSQLLLSGHPEHSPTPTNLFPKSH